MAGVATGLVATGQVAGTGFLRREKLFSVAVNNVRRDIALVDVALSADRWIGARALWRVDELREAFVTFANPSALGISAVAGLLSPVARSATNGLRLRFAPLSRAQAVVTVPLAPGLLVPVGIDDVSEISPGEITEISSGEGCLALDGERGSSSAPTIGPRSPCAPVPSSSMSTPSWPTRRHTT